jgi:hypothetical protein
MFLLVSCHYATKIERRSAEWPVDETLSIFEQLLALYLRYSAFCAPLPISLSFLPSAVVEVGFRTSEFVQTPTGTVAARVWSQEVQELKSLDFHFLNCPNQLQEVFLDMPSPLSE